VAPRPGVPVAPDALYFRNRELVRILGRLVWFESNGDHIIIQDPHDSCGPRDLEGMRRAVVDLRDDMGSAHQTLFCMQNIMDDRRVEQVAEMNAVRDMSVHPPPSERHFEMFILDDWAPFHSIVLQSLTTVAFAGQACLQSHAAYRPPPSSLATQLNVVCAELQGLRVGLESPSSLGGPPSSVPSLVSVTSSSSQSSSPLPVIPGRWR
jgi:hypothetical protein